MIKLNDGTCLQEIANYSFNERLYEQELRSGIELRFKNEAVQGYDLMSLFIHGTTFSIIEEAISPVNGQPIMAEYPVDKYTIAGEITYNRDNTVSVFMYKPTTIETLEAENAALLLQTLTGGSI